MTLSRTIGGAGAASPDPAYAGGEDRPSARGERAAVASLREAQVGIGRANRRRPETSADEVPGLAPARRLVHQLQLRHAELAAENAALERSRDQLAAAQLHLRELFDHAPVGYLTLDEAGRVVEANLTTARLLETGRDRLVGQLFADFVVAPDRVAFAKILLPPTPGAASSVRELRLLRSGGASFWARLEAGAVPGGAGCRLVMSDITECRRCARDRDELERRQRQLHKAEGLNRMAEAIAHRFNNLLGAVLGGLEVAMSDPPRHGTPAVGLDEALTATLQAAELSTVMLTYLGHSRVRRELLDLAELCRQALPDLRKVAPTEVALTADLPAAGPVVRADAQQLLQVVTGLTTNAWEALGGGRGVVRLSVTSVPSPLPHAAVRFPLDWQPLAVPHACLEVADDGCGISEEDLERLFDPFFSTKFCGRGLGMAVVLGITRAHFGAVEVASEVGRGTVVRVLLPTAADAGRPPVASPA